MTIITYYICLQFCEQFFLDLVKSQSVNMLPVVKDTYPSVNDSILMCESILICEATRTHFLKSKDIEIAGKIASENQAWYGIKAGIQLLEVFSLVCGCIYARVKS